MPEPTETFNCKLLDVREQSLKIEHIGKVCYLPRSQIERWSTKNDGIVTVTIPYWLYAKKFHPQESPV